MTVRCSLSGHAPARTTVENQGFQFSRCTRCGHDMIRSITSPGAQWKPVPEGFRVDWGSTDLSVFQRKSPITVAILAVRDTVTATIAAIRITISLLVWRMIDALRGMNRRSRNALDAAGRAIHMSQPRPNWNLSVQISVGRTPRSDQPAHPEALVA